MDKLGIQLPMLLTQIVNFTIMLIILTKFLYKPILKALKNRKEKIAQGLEYAEKMRLDEEKLNEKHEEILQKARLEAKVIIENVKKDAQKVKSEIIESGHKEVTGMKQKMLADAENRQKEISEEMEKKTVNIAAEMAKKLLVDLITPEQQHALIKNNLQKLAKSHEK